MPRNYFEMRNGLTDNHRRGRIKAYVLSMSPVAAPFLIVTHLQKSLVPVSCIIIFLTVTLSPSIDSDCAAVATEWEASWGW